MLRGCRSIQIIFGISAHSAILSRPGKGAANALPSLTTDPDLGRKQWLKTTVAQQRRRRKVILGIA